MKRILSWILLPIGLMWFVAMLIYLRWERWAFSPAPRRRPSIFSWYRIRVRDDDLKRRGFEVDAITPLRRRYELRRPLAARQSEGR